MQFVVDVFIGSFGFGFRGLHRRGGGSDAAVNILLRHVSSVDEFFVDGKSWAVIARSVFLSRHREALSLPEGRGDPIVSSARSDTMDRRFGRGRHHPLRLRRGWPRARREAG